MKPTSMMPELSEASLLEIARLGGLRFPNEACGLLLEIPYRDGHGRMTHIVELPNRSLRPSDSYMMSQDDLRLTMEDKPDQKVAAWHTHPGGLVGPSAKDMQARPPDEIPMLVVAMTDYGPVPAWF